MDLNKLSYEKANFYIPYKLNLLYNYIYYYNLTINIYFFILNINEYKLIRLLQFL
jgi:hypothetical protein